MKGWSPKSVNVLFEVKELDYGFRNCTKLYQPNKRTTSLRSVSYMGANGRNAMWPILTYETNLNNFTIFTGTLDENSLDRLFNLHINILSGTLIV